MTILVAGTGNGLGRYLHEELGGLELRRGSAVSGLGTARPLEAIIHCAFSSRRNASASTLPAYIDDNLFLTQRLTEVPHRKFVLISSIDVYPVDDRTHDETEDIALDKGQSLYGTTKLLAESIVRTRCPDHLILRSGLLLGPYMRTNNLVRLLDADANPLGLTADSAYCCVLYADLLAFLRLALRDNVRGIFNAARAKQVTLAELSARFHPRAVFGGFRYRAPLVSNEKIASVCAVFSGSSVEAVEQFARERA